MPVPVSLDCVSVFVWLIETKASSLVYRKSVKRRMKTFTFQLNASEEILVAFYTCPNILSLKYIFLVVIEFIFNHDSLIVFFLFLIICFHCLVFNFQVLKLLEQKYVLIIFFSLISHILKGALSFSSSAVILILSVILEIP